MVVYQGMTQGLLIHVKSNRRGQQLERSQGDEQHIVNASNSLRLPPTLPSIHGLV